MDLGRREKPTVNDLHVGVNTHAKVLEDRIIGMVQHLQSVLDGFQTLWRLFDSEFYHVGHLALVQLVGVALVLLDLQKLHRQESILAFRHLDEGEVGEGQADVESLGEIVVD